MNNDTLVESYKLGRRLALDNFEKTAFLGAALTGGKFLLGMGNLGRAGSMASRISTHHIGMPLGFGAIGALTADEGKRMEGFAGGFIGGLGFNLGMSAGGAIGKRLFSPFGRGAKGLKRMGFEDDASSLIQASRVANKNLNKVRRRMDSGNFNASTSMEYVDDALKGSGVDVARLPADLAKQLQTLKQTAGSVTPANMKQFANQLSEFTGNLAKQGVGMGSASAQAMYRGSRMAKNIGGIVGGIGVGMAADHALRGVIETPPSSIYSTNYNKPWGH